MDTVIAIIVIVLIIDGFIFFAQDAKEHGIIAVIAEVIGIIILAAFGL